MRHVRGSLGDRRRCAREQRELERAALLLARKLAREREIRQVRERVMPRNIAEHGVAVEPMICGVARHRLGDELRRPWRIVQRAARRGFPRVGHGRMNISPWPRWKRYAAAWVHER